jgi:hypothetical protein
MVRVNLPSYALQPRNDTAGEPIAAALTRARNGPAQLESIGRADGGGRGRVRAGEHVSEGEGGEGFYIAQSGRCPDLLVI